MQRDVVVADVELLQVPVLFQEVAELSPTCTSEAGTHKTELCES